MTESPARSGTAVLDLAGFVCACAWGGLCYLSLRETPIPLAYYYLALAVAWGATIYSWQFLHHRELPNLWKRLLAWGILFRVIGLLGNPIYEDDPWRYLWDGRMFAVTGSPYLNTPMDHYEDADLSELFQSILYQVNYAQFPTIYGPTCQWMFLAGYFIAPGQLWPLKVFLILAEVAVFFILRKWARPSGLLLFAWCPLSIQETAFSAHPDALGIMLVMLALDGMLRNKDNRASVCTALSLGARFISLILAPYALRRMRWRQAGLFIAVICTMYLPFLLQEGKTEFAVFGTFAKEWEFNSSLFAILAGITGRSSARMIGAVLFTGLWLLVYARWKRESPPGMPRGDWLFLGFLFLSPVANPWYFLWILPFVAIHPSAMGITALACVSLSYIHGLTWPESGIEPFHHPVWLRPLEFGLIALAGMWDIALWLRRKKPVQDIRT